MKKQNFFEHITDEQSHAINNLAQIIATIHPQLQDEAIVAVVRFVADNMIEYNIKKCNIIQKNVA